MKRIIISAFIAISGVVSGAAPAMAQVVISNTGPDSNNTITDESSTHCTSTSDNSATVNNNTNQSSSSGSGSVSGNTTGGSATSGDASNSSTTTTQVSESNTNACLPASTSSTPSGGGRGAGGGSGAGGEVQGVSTVAGGLGAGEVTVLPNTGGSSPLENTFGLLAAISGLTVVTRVLRRSFDQTA